MVILLLIRVFKLTCRKTKKGSLPYSLHVKKKVVELLLEKHPQVDLQEDSFTVNKDFQKPSTIASILKHSTHLYPASLF